jgi:hypothetical protein
VEVEKRVAGDLRAVGVAGPSTRDGRTGCNNTGSASEYALHTQYTLFETLLVRWASERLKLVVPKILLKTQLPHSKCTYTHLHTRHLHSH